MLRKEDSAGRCVAELSSEELAKRHEQSTNHHYGLFLRSVQISCDVKNRLDGFMTIEGDHPAIRLCFKDSHQLFGEMHMDASYLNVIEFVLNAVRRAGLVEKLPVTITDEATDNKAYANVSLAYKPNVACEIIFPDATPIRDLRVRLFPGGFDLELPLGENSLTSRFVGLLDGLGVTCLSRNLDVRPN